MAALDNRVDYGKALLAVEEHRGIASTLALGARDGSLLARVQRLAGLTSTGHRSVAGGFVALLSAAIFTVPLAMAVMSGLSLVGDEKIVPQGKESNGLQFRLIGLSSEVSDDAPDLENTTTNFKRSAEMTFGVELKNVSRESITSAGVRYGDGYGPESQGNLNTAMFAPHWFDFEFTDREGKPIPRTRRELCDSWSIADNASTHVLAPGQSLVAVLRPARFHPPMDFDLLPGKYQVRVRYHGPSDSFREKVRKHWPDKPILNAWPYEVTSNVSAFSIDDASRRTKPEDLIWGKPVDGLQAAIEYRLPDNIEGNPMIEPGVAVGSAVGVVFHVHNVSNQPITFISETSRQGDYAHIVDEHGNKVDVQVPFFSGLPIDVAWKLEPGETAQLSLLVPGIESIDQPGKYLVRYTVRFNSRIQKDDAGNVIFPRPGDYDKELDTGETPLFLSPMNKDLSANGEMLRRPVDTIAEGHSGNGLVDAPKDVIHWGESKRGLRIGAKWQANRTAYELGKTLEAQLYLSNTSNKEIDCMVELPWLNSGWPFVVRDVSGSDVKLQFEPWHVEIPERLMPLKLAPGEQVQIAGEGAKPFWIPKDQQDTTTAMLPSARFVIVDRNEEVELQDWPAERSRPKLIATEDAYRTVFKVRLIFLRPEISVPKISLESAPVPFSVLHPTMEEIEAANVAADGWGRREATTKFRLKLSPYNDQSPKVGEPILVKLEAKNESNRFALLDPAIFPPHKVMTVVDANGQTVTTIGTGKRSPNSSRPWQPKGLVDVWEAIDLSEYFLLDEGEYEVAVAEVNAGERMKFEPSNSLKIRVGKGSWTPFQRAILAMREHVPKDWNVTAFDRTIYVTYHELGPQKLPMEIQVWFRQQNAERHSFGRPGYVVVQIGTHPLGPVYVAAPVAAKELWPNYLDDLKLWLASLSR